MSLCQFCASFRHSQPPAERFKELDQCRGWTATDSVVSLDSRPKCQGAQQRVNLAESVLLPLFWRPVTQSLGLFDETSHASRTVPFERIKFFRDVLEAAFATFVPQQWATLLRQEPVRNFVCGA